MIWPIAPIESIAPQQFTPPHCPWAACPTHDPLPPAFRFRRHGSFTRSSDRRSVPRFLCLACRRTFSQQTFAASYYLKRPDLSVPIAAGLVAGSAHRQLARSLHCGPTTVTRRAARLGRHALLLQARTIRSLRGLREPLCYDHFESFAHSQDEPCGVGTLTGHLSWLLYGLDFAPHRRTGRTTPAQEARRRSWTDPPASRADPYRVACRESFSSLIERLDPAQPIIVFCDGKGSYLRAFNDRGLRGRVAPRIHPNPRRGPKGSARSPEAVARDKAMFPVDLLHGLLRHSAAHHRRETIAFGRRHNAMLERIFLFAVWRNLVKSRSERDRWSLTPAAYLGIVQGAWSWERVLAQRLFAWQERVPENWKKIYLREIRTRGLSINRRHDLINAA